MEKQHILNILNDNLAHFVSSNLIERIANEILVLNMPVTACLLPWVSVEFTTAWANWIQYRKDEKLPKYKTAKSEQSILNGLVKKSGNNESIAILIIEASIENHYQGLFPLKNIIVKNEKSNRHEWQQ